MEELWSLDDSMITEIEPILAFIFLFKWVGNDGKNKTAPAGKLDPDFPGYFANQTINNACATLAILNGVLNLDGQDGIVLGEELSNLKNFSQGFDSRVS